MLRKKQILELAWSGQTGIGNSHTIYHVPVRPLGAGLISATVGLSPTVDC